MSEQHITRWLEPYLDGELPGMRRRQVEAHLKTCAACRAELEDLRVLSALLQAHPQAPATLSAGRFVAQVQLRLPRQEKTTLERAVERGRWAVPVLLLGVWVVVLGIWGLSGVLLAAGEVGLFESLGLGWLIPTAGAGLWPTIDFSRGGGSVVAELRQAVDTLHWLVLIPLELLVTIGVLYWSWLVGWRYYQQHQSQTNQMGR
ncbi:MAG: zf-HC2 domain-containing protein [Anaerolineae bacterium]|nr:zf-HC2 domain-containing protein [Anaerolineae bacterium]